MFDPHLPPTFIMLGDSVLGRRAMNHKGKAETVEVETDELSAGDHVDMTVGDWNGTGFSYHANGGGSVSAYVVEAFDDKATMVFTHDRLEWTYNGDTSLEFTINADGTIEGVEIGSYNNPRIKSYNVPEHRGGYHKVAHGIEKTRNQ